MCLHAAGVKQSLVNPPVEEVITESQHANIVCDVKLPCPVEIQNRVKGTRMSNKYKMNIHVFSKLMFYSSPVKEILVFLKVII